LSILENEGADPAGAVNERAGDSQSRILDGAGAGDASGGAVNAFEIDGEERFFPDELELFGG
jgi:hypothetical protein